MKTIVIIPALNEAGNIAAVVGETLEQAVDGVIVVDNGSTDNTAGMAREAGARVVHEPREGYGFACWAGSRAAMDAGADILVYLDGDGSADPGEIRQLIVPLQQDEADLVLGSRMLGHIDPGAMPPHQRFGNWLSAQLMRRLYGVAVTDLGPFRAIRVSLFESLGMREMTYGWPTEMMVKTVRNGGRLIETPVSWRRRRSGRSKVGGTLRGSLLAAFYILGVTLRYARA